MTAAWKRGLDAARGARYAPTLQPVRRRLPLLSLVLAGYARRRGRTRLAATAAAVGLAGYAYVYRRHRAQGLEQRREQEARMARLRRDALEHFYRTCITSMEEELQEFPAYDQHKHEQRYELLAEIAREHLPRGGTVVDVGCASGIVLDRVAPAKQARAVGFDLSPLGLRLRARRADPPVLAQALVEAMPLPDGVADVVVFSEVIEHLVDAYQGMREVSRVTRPGGVVILTTNNASEMPSVSPLEDPGTWIERLVGRHRPSVLGYRNITWHDPINDPEDPLPPEAPTYVPHFHFAYRELADLAADAGFAVERAGSFQFPAPQSGLAQRFRELVDRAPALGYGLSDLFERAVALTPGLRTMGTAHLLVLRKVREPRPAPRTPWWPAQLVPWAREDAAASPVLAAGAR